MNAGINNNIHVNPNFIPKCPPKIHLNPTFVNTVKFDSYLNSHSDDFYTPEPIYENVMESIAQNGCTTSSYPYYNTNIENSSTPYQDYSDQFLDLAKTHETNSSGNLASTHATYSSDFFHKLEQPLYEKETHAKARKFFSTDYLKSRFVDVPIQETCKNISNSLSSNHLNQQISKVQKPINKAVIMGQRMIKNHQIYPPKNIYSVDYRVPQNLHKMLAKPISTFNGKSHLLSKPSFKVQNEVKEIYSNNCSKTPSLHISSILPVTSGNSIIQNMNGVSSFIHELPKVDSCKTPSKSSALIANEMSDFESCRSFMLEPSANLSTSTKSSPTFESRPTFFKSSMKLIRRDTLRKSAKFIREDILVKKRKYAVKTKTKLIRRNSSNSKYPKFSNTTKLSKLRRSLRLKKGTLLKAKEKMMFNHYSRPNTNRPVIQKQSAFKSKYKFVKDGILLSRYRFNRNPQQKSITPSSPSKNNKNIWPLKLKRNTKKSDKFININGNLYKSTATSLKKQDLTPKSRKAKPKPPSPKFKFKKFSFRNSKFVYRRQNSTKLESGTLIEIVRRKKLAQFKRVNDFCFFYNKYGKCKKQNKGCPFIHDPSKIAICTRFLQGTCTETTCPFSHIMDKNKMPICSHFQDNLCSKEDCPYRHVRVNPKAPVCKNFLKGFCPQGEECKKKHILICEDFNKDGTCPRGKKCPLSHRKPKSKPVKKPKTNTTVPKRKKQKTKSGVLGMASTENDKVREGKVPSSNSNRYFDCPDYENRKSEPPSDDSITVDLEQKRERILKKLEIFKKNYHKGDDDFVVCNNNVLTDAKPSRKLSVIDATANNDIISQPESSSSFKPHYFPLPDVMPSFIPLVMPEHLL